MYPCNECLENNWKFKYNNGFITAICQNCGNYIEFKAKKKKKLAVGVMCKCGQAVLTQKELKFNKKKLKRLYYYTHCYYCSACKKHFYSDEFKIVNKDYKIDLPKLF